MENHYLNKSIPYKWSVFHNYLDLPEGISFAQYFGIQDLCRFFQCETTFAPGTLLSPLSELR